MLNKILLPEYNEESIRAVVRLSSTLSHLSKTKTRLTYCKPFSYWEVFKHSYLCPKKANPRQVEYIQLMKIFEQKLDIEKVVGNSESIRSISRKILLPYQQRLILEFTSIKIKDQEDALELKFEAAYQALVESCKNPNRDLMHRRIDEKI